MKIKEIYPDVLIENIEYEFKSVLNKDNPIKWAKTLVAFANNGGGVLFVGVSNDGEAFGMALSDVDNTKNLVALVNNRHIFPHISISYLLNSVDKDAEKYILGIKVEPSDSIVIYKDGDFNETVYVKGDGNVTPATPKEIISLGKRMYSRDNFLTDIQYDESKWTAYISLCKEYREDGSKPSIKELQNEEIISKDGYIKSGFLMFCDEYSDSDTLVCCRLWRGSSKIGAVLDSGRFKGPLPKVFNYTIDFIERNTKTGWEKTSDGGRKSVRSYPKEAIREALVNAIAHRDYSIDGTQIDVDIYDDRIDIVSPGSWLLAKPYDNYPVGEIPSVRRNTIIAACLDVANLMERGGTGFQTIVQSYKDASQDKQPIVVAHPGFLDLRLYDLLYDNSDIDLNMSDEEKVINYLKNGPKRVKELQEVCNYTNRSRFLRDVINPLLKANRIERVGNSKSPSSFIKLIKE